MTTRLASLKDKALGRDVLFSKQVIVAIYVPIWLLMVALVVTAGQLQPALYVFLHTCVTGQVLRMLYRVDDETLAPRVRAYMHRFVLMYIVYAGLIPVLLLTR